jgi:hypothetical protein
MKGIEMEISCGFPLHRGYEGDLRRNFVWFSSSLRG